MLQEIQKQKEKKRQEGKWKCKWIKYRNTKCCDC